MKIKYITLTLILALCFTFLAGCKSYNVEYINEHMKNDVTNLQSANYRRLIKSSEVAIFEEKIVSTRSGDVFNQAITTIELAGVEDGNQYVNSSDERTVSAEAMKNNMQLKEEYFVKSSLEIDETSLTGTLNETSVLEFLGIPSAKDVLVTVYLYEDLTLHYISVEYTDSNTNYAVSISIEYFYYE